MICCPWQCLPPQRVANRLPRFYPVGEVMANTFWRHEFHFVDVRKNVIYTKTGHLVFTDL